MLRIENLRKSFGGVVATNGVSLDFPTGSLTAVIGPNGAGKTTFFNLISGFFGPDSGRVELDGRDITGLPPHEIVRAGIGRAFQIARIFPTMTVREQLQGAVNAHHHRHVSMLSRFPLASSRERTDFVLDLLGLTAKADTISKNLSHGDQKLLDVALALVHEPRVLLLDEPTAGMGPEERWQMINTIHRMWEREKMTLVYIEHDMDIVFKIAQTIRVLSYGAVLAEGTPDEIRKNPAVIEAYLGQSFEAERA